MNYEFYKELQRSGFTALVNDSANERWSGIAALASGGPFTFPHS
jgi:hypothetical protein